MARDEDLTTGATGLGHGPNHGRHTGDRDDLVARHHSPRALSVGTLINRGKETGGAPKH
jgi:hypothetical protein